MAQRSGDDDARNEKESVTPSPFFSLSPCLPLFLSPSLYRAPSQRETISLSFFYFNNLQIVHNRQIKFYTREDKGEQREEGRREGRALALDLFSL